MFFFICLFTLNEESAFQYCKDFLWIPTWALAEFPSQINPGDKEMGNCLVSSSSFIIWQITCWLRHTYLLFLLPGSLTPNRIETFKTTIPWIHYYQDSSWFCLHLQTWISSFRMALPLSLQGLYTTFWELWLLRSMKCEEKENNTSIVQGPLVELPCLWARDLRVTGNLSSSLPLINLEGFSIVKSKA